MKTVPPPLMLTPVAPAIAPLPVTVYAPPPAVLLNVTEPGLTAVFRVTVLLLEVSLKVGLSASKYTSGLIACVVLFQFCVVPRSQAAELLAPIQIRDAGLPTAV